MFMIAHLGFTAAPAALATRWWGENRGFVERVPDLRWLLAGAVLPDIVDKVIGQVLFKPYFENGRIFCHTLMLVLFLFAAGVYQWRRRGDSRILLLACGVASHLVLDKMWAEPATAFWPALGPFVRHSSLKTILAQIMESVRDPFFWTSELAGAALLIASMRFLGVRTMRDLKEFLLSGRLPFLAQPETSQPG